MGSYQFYLILLCQTWSYSNAFFSREDAPNLNVLFGPSAVDVHQLRYGAPAQPEASILSSYNFPKNFLWGVSTSSYQTEGAWNESGKGENIWDHNLHKNTSIVVDGSNGDKACDSYNKWREDIQLLKNLGVNFYRFSISWSRILPNGYKDSEINQAGVAYYSEFIDALLVEGIQPYVTIYHWDLPQTLQDKGGWLNATIIDDYIYYAKLLFQLYGGRVKHWITFNEFLIFCEAGYSNGQVAPFLELSGIGGYQCTHHALLAHAKTFRLYEKEFKPTQGGQIGISVVGDWCEGATNSEADIAASRQFMEFGTGWFLRPIVLGNYPPIMIERVDKLSAQQGFKESRLPKFTDEEITMLKGSFDFLGLNHYFTMGCTFDDNFPQPSHKSDCGVLRQQKLHWEISAAPRISYTPWGLRRILNWVKEEYNNPAVLITENGYPMVANDLEDTDRVNHLKEYLSDVLKAIYDDGCNVIGFTYWSMMDNLEWVQGYTLKFGLIKVDFHSPNRTRTPRSSYNVFKDVIRTGRIS